MQHWSRGYTKLVPCNVFCKDPAMIWKQDLKKYAESLAASALVG